MGYDIHITRKDHWSDTEGSEIEFDEWSDIVDSDDDLLWDEEGELSDVRWKDVLFWFSDGNISTKNPPQDALAKMFELAQRLQAVVQGDEGEFYDERGLQKDPVNAPADPVRVRRRPISRWRKFLKRLLFRK